MRHQTVPMNLLSVRNGGRCLVLFIMLRGIFGMMELVWVLMQQSLGNWITLAQMVLMNNSQVR